MSTTGVEFDPPRFRGAGSGERAQERAGFTLIELLTVMAIIAVLASLLLTSLMSARRKSRTTVCTFNLHQICLAAHMYLDEAGKRPTPDSLVAGKFIPNPRTFLCPEDRTGNWGGLVRSANGTILFASASLSTNDAGPLNHSYLFHPLDWDEATWKRLLRLGSAAGIAACQLHGIGTQEHPDVRNYSGLLLRGQLDGAVVRRKIFWSSLAFNDAPRDADPGVGSLSPNSNGPSTSLNSLYPFQIYVDDPTRMVSE